MFRFRSGLLPLRLSSRLTEINTVINTINAAKRHTLHSLVCELQLAPQLHSQFHYLLALLGHIYCYTYEVLGPRVYLTMPGYFNLPSALSHSPHIEALFEHKQYTLPYNYEENCHLRTQKTLPPVVKFTLGEFPLHQFPPFYPKIAMDSVPKFKETVLGGTFDYLHPGHMLLLTSLALVTTEKMHIGLTHDALLSKKTFPALIQQYDVRESEIRKVLSHLVPHKSLNIIRINDPVGPAATEKHWEAIVLSREVEAAGNEINTLREKNGLTRMETVLVDLVQLGTHKISSTDIRALINERAEYQTEKLRDHWLSLCSSLRISPTKAEYWWTKLITNYMRHDRYYHSLTQIVQILQLKQDLRIETSPALDLGIWFHDVIFYADVKNNVENCAGMYQEFVEDVGLQGYEQVREYILATSGHRPRTKDKEELVLLDLDLSILGTDPLQYLQYAEGVKKEFSFIGGFESGRRKVLKKFIERESIFITPMFRKLFENKARLNIMSELSRLS